VTLLAALRRHWPEMLIEAGGLGTFMLSACVCAALLFHPGSPLAGVLGGEVPRRALMGLAMGATLVALVYSPWGQRSGAHFNPVLTLTFLALRRIEPADAMGYVVAQFAGAWAGVTLAGWLLGAAIVGDPAVNHVVTAPGAAGPLAAFAAEVAISFGMMALVLFISNRRDLNRYTGLAAAALLALYITFESPLSGTSMNPARSLGSAVPAGMFGGLWIYFAAPAIGMAMAAAIYVRAKGRGAVLCCKLHHDNGQRCIFRCRYGAQTHSAAATVTSPEPA
jgi:aquaporin Z